MKEVKELTEVKGFGQSQPQVGKKSGIMGEVAQKIYISSTTTSKENIGKRGLNSNYLFPFCCL